MNNILVSEIKNYIGYDLQVEDHSQAIHNEIERIYGKKEIPISYEEAIKEATLIGVGTFDIAPYVHLVAYPKGEDIYLNWKPSLYKIKPIVRPISDLEKEITHNGETFVPIDFLKNKYQDIYFYTENNKVNLSVFFRNYSYFYHWYEILNHLYEWHFDVFGWLEKDLAINYNEYHGNTH